MMESLHFQTAAIYRQWDYILETSQRSLRLASTPLFFRSNGARRRAIHDCGSKWWEINQPHSIQILYTKVLDSLIGSMVGASNFQQSYNVLSVHIMKQRLLESYSYHRVVAAICEYYRVSPQHTQSFPLRSTAIPWARQSSVPRKCCLAQNYTP